MNAPAGVPCSRCVGGQMFRYPHPDGPEWHCLTCGHVSYGEGYEPLKVPETYRGKRGASHGKVRL